MVYVVALGDEFLAGLLKHLQAAAGSDLLTLHGVHHEVKHEWIAQQVAQANALYVVQKNAGLGDSAAPLPEQVLHIGRRQRVKLQNGDGATRRRCRKRGRVQHTVPVGLAAGQAKPWSP